MSTRVNPGLINPRLFIWGGAISIANSYCWGEPPQLIINLGLTLYIYIHRYDRYVLVMGFCMGVARLGVESSKQMTCDPAEMGGVISIPPSLQVGGLDIDLDTKKIADIADEHPQQTSYFTKPGGASWPATTCRPR